MKINLLLLLVLITSQIQAEIKLPDLFQDKMVLQRNQELIIWGWADKDEKVTVSFNGQTRKTKADKEGKWQVVLNAMPASSEPLEMKVSGKNEITIKNILIGDLWICSGQSNMNYIIERFSYAEKEAKSANFPLLRMITVEKEFSVIEEKELTTGKWIEAVGTDIYGFSATAYFFGKNLHQNLDIPIGLIASSWGGTNVESWMPQLSLNAFPTLNAVFQNKKKDLLAQNIEEKEAERSRLIDTIAKTGIGIDEQWYLPEHEISGWEEMVIPMEKTNPVFEAVDGALWLKKEFEIPTPFRGRDLKFNLGQINDYDKVWINGHEVGESIRNTDWRNYTVKKEILKPGKNQITVRIFDYSNTGGWITNPFYINMHPIGDTKGYYLLSGDWKYKMGKVLQQPLILPEIPDRLFRLTQTIPSCLFNKMIYPITQLSITGVIWYQGESNESRAFEYSQFFPAMIQGWRKAFRQDDLPFLFVQLPNYQGKKSQGLDDKAPNWPELRFAQSKGLELPNTGMAVAIDLGEAKNIHPQNKQDVGKRLALAALGIQYHQNIQFKAPTYQAKEIQGNKIYLTFNDVADSLINTNEDYEGPLLNHFEVADESGVFYPAKAKIISENTIEVWNDKVKLPKDVRYAWRNNPDNINFYSNKGLPVIPFRTDEWEWETKNNSYVDQVKKLSIE
ncbi:sialate O-acetylesterase [Flexithrix dorotheae]|uniref:sialate O-acetylesterase n=1 Tax=Flexithrix dorotheae TaxID=70993 RepID=UPI000367EB9C|nr:sialate O-acetylesterase [Flexithrix dorotheae]